jgi:predicted nicotinamide N-methyase
MGACGRQDGAAPMPDDRSELLRRFVVSSTTLRPVPLVPEVRLHLTDDVTALWQRTEAELGGPALDPPFWASAWAGGQAVARFLLDEPGRVAGRTLLDLGSGSGLCAIAAALAGASVTAADVDEVAMAAIGVNAAANAVRVQAVRRDLLDDEPPAVDVVVAGDVCYERSMSERALAWLRLARDRGADVLLGDPGRAYLPSAGLTAVAHYPMAADLDLESPRMTRASVFTLP